MAPIRTALRGAKEHLLYRAREEYQFKCLQVETHYNEIQVRHTEL
jgi:hypothetical protein